MSGKKIYAMMGASGNIGGRAARRLLEAGMEVRVIGRSADKMKSLIDKGGKFIATKLENPTELAQAFQGIDGAFVMIPPNLTSPNVRKDQNKIADVIVAAIERSKIQNIVALSSIGANHAEGVGPVKGLHDFEVRLEKLKRINICVYRCAFFMENTFNFIPIIQSMGFAAGSGPGNAPIPMIATRDIGDRVADSLTKLDFKDYTVKYLLGQREVSMEEAMRILGEAIRKKELAYRQVSPEQAKAGMVQSGMSEDTASNLVELSLAGKLLAPTEPRSAESTTPTAIEQFAKQEFTKRFEAIAVSK